MKILGLVTAKSQSNRVKNKNKKLINGKQLYLWTTRFLERNADLFDTLVFSSDDPGAFKVGKHFTKLIRPKVLCEDSTPHVMSVKHAFLRCESMYKQEYDYVFLFQPTNPIRERSDIETMIDMMTVSRASIGKTYYVDENINQSYVIGASFDNELNENGILVRSGNMYAYNRLYLIGSKWGMGGDVEDAYITIPKYRGYNINNSDDFAIVESLMRKYKCK